MWQATGEILSAGPWALLGLLAGFILVSLVRGWLVAAPVHDRIVAALKEQVAWERSRAEEYRLQVSLLLAQYAARHAAPPAGS